MNKIIALTGGTFDPVTTGHLRFFERASAMCDILYIGIFDNPDKKPRFTTEKRFLALKEAVKHINNVIVIKNSGYLADYAVSIGASIIIKGIRDEKDKAYEDIMADFNFKRSGIKTIYITAEPEYASVSSTLVKKLEREGKSFSSFLPDGVYNILYK